MLTTIKVLIIEDDFRVAEIHRQQVESLAGFRVMAIAKSAEESLDLLQQASDLPDLILLDVYIPDSPDLKLFRQLRKKYTDIDIVFVTAAKETVTITEALHGGIFDYLIKPVSFERFERTFERYRSQKVLLESKQELTQNDIDRLREGSGRLKEMELFSGDLPKGIDRITLDRIAEILKESPRDGINAIDAGEAAGVSRSTARRYLEYLVSAERAKTLLNYGDVGRPERKYVSLD